MATFRRELGWLDGAALTVTAVLGSGILYLPALTASLAGPGALIAWAGMGLLSGCFALTFLHLSVRRPDAGGIAAFAGSAFGPAARLTAGWYFLGALPIGGPVAALIGVDYMGAVLPLSHLEEGVFAVGLFGIAITLNWLGVSFSGRAAGIVMAAVSALLLVSVVANIGRVRAPAFHPFLPHGLGPVGLSAALLFWAYVGWEAVAHYAEEFRDVKRDLPRSLLVSVILIVALYLAVEWVTLGTGAFGAGRTQVSLALVMGDAFGAAGRVVMAVFALLICYGTIHTYMGSQARLVYALARSGDFAPYFNHLNARTGTPTRALGWLFLVFVLVLAADLWGGVSLESLLGWSAGLFIGLYALAMAAGVRLLRGRSQRVTAAIGLAASLAVLPFLGWAALLPVAIAGMAVWWQRRRAGGSVPAPAGDTPGVPAPR